ncbi:1,4-beta-xylanase, partial [Streptomyces sp. NPDC005474]
MPVILSRLTAVLVAAGLLLVSQTAVTPERAAAANPGYLMVHFTGDSATGQMLYVAHSADGLHWNDLNGGAPVLNS